MTVVEDWLVGTVRTAAVERDRYTMRLLWYGEGSKASLCPSYSRMPAQGCTQRAWLHVMLLLGD